MITARNQYDVVILHGQRLVERTIVGVHALKREALRRLQAVVVRLFERALVRQIIGIMLMRRITRRMTAGRANFDDEQMRGGLGLRQDVADEALIQPRPACEALHRRRLDQPRRQGCVGGRRTCDTDFGSRMRSHDDFVACRKIDGIRGSIFEHIAALADVAPRFTAVLHGYFAGENDDAQLVVWLLYRNGIARAQTIRRKADIFPSR